MEATRIGMRLKELREAKGLTQKQLADAANISQRTVSHIEQGRNEPTLSTAASLARVLDVTVNSFLEPPSATTEPAPRGRPTKAESLTDAKSPAKKKKAK